MLLPLWAEEFAPHPDDLSAFIACRLIPLNKSPGVRPIGVGEVPRRIIAKAVLSLFRLDIQDAAGPLHYVPAKMEAVRQLSMLCINFSLNRMYKEPCWSTPLNTINRQAALHNIK